MAEKPTKLFGTRSEQYPEADDSDIAAALVRTALEDIPGIKTVIKFLNLFVQPELTRREVKWLKDFADDFDRFKEQFNPEVLGKNKAFVSAFVRASRIAAGTHQEEKRKMLRNALLNIAAGKAPSDDLQHVFFSAIDEFTPSHVRVLKVLWTGMQDLIQKGLWKAGGTAVIPNYDGVFALLLPELKGSGNLVQLILTDLRLRGFSNLTGLDVPFPNTTMITNLGIEFMHFIMEPDPQK